MHHGDHTSLSFTPAARLAACLLGAALCGCAAAGRPAVPLRLDPADIVLRVASARREDPAAAGREAALALRKAMGDTEPHAILVAECFENEDLKRSAIDGVAAVFPREKIFGAATYGSYSQEGCLDLDAISLLGIGGSGISVTAAVDEGLGTAGLTLENDEQEIAERLRAAGARLARQLPPGETSRLLLILPDAHSPKNQYIVEGAQQVLGEDFPMTGGSANKNAGETFVYHRGRVLADSAVALLLSGDFRIGMSGRQARENDLVISSARAGAVEALGRLGGRPIGAIAFNCAGRKGKLDDIEDELRAVQQVLGTEVPIFGCYCAGEIGPADPELAATSGKEIAIRGVGWHVMLTILGR